jgi:Mg/Co/Ni transporter MgtE
MELTNDQVLIGCFLTDHPHEALEAIESMGWEELILFLENLPDDQTALVLSRLAGFKAARVIEQVSVEKASRCLLKMQFFEIAHIIRIVKEPFRSKIYQLLPIETAKNLKKSLSFSSSQVGAHMDPDVLTFFKDQTVDIVLKELKSSTNRTNLCIYVLDRNKKLVGFLMVSDLISGDPDKSLASIMQAVSYHVSPEMNVKDLLENWKTDFMEVPVVKVDKEFLGAVTISALRGATSGNKISDNLAWKAGNALGDLYLIGLASILGRSDQNT